MAIDPDKPVIKGPRGHGEFQLHVFWENTDESVNYYVYQTYPLGVWQHRLHYYGQSWYSLSDRERLWDRMVPFGRWRVLG